jgi:hypothetical protein
VDDEVVADGFSPAVKVASQIGHCANLPIEAMGSSSVRLQAGQSCLKSVIGSYFLP